MELKPRSPRRPRVRLMLALGTAIAGLTTSLGLALTTPALADPTVMLVAVGDDTTQHVYNQFATDVAGRLLGSYDATNPSTGGEHEIITPVDGTAHVNCSFARPDGSAEGVADLRLSLDPASINAIAAPVPVAQQGCVDIARSAAPPGSLQSGTGPIVYVPFALDGTAGATGPASCQGTTCNSYQYTYAGAGGVQTTVTATPVPTAITHADLFTMNDLTTLYANGGTVTEGGVTYWPLGSPNPAPTGSQQIDLYLPQPGSSTVDSWAAALGLDAASLPAWVHQNIAGGPLAGVPVEDYDGTAVATDSHGFGPFSISQWIAQRNGRNDRRHTALLHTLAMCTGTTCTAAVSPFSNGTPATGSLNPSFPITGPVYSVVSYARVINPSDPLYFLLNGPTSTMCRDRVTISNFGFALLSSTCGEVINSLRAQGSGLPSKPPYATSVSASGTYLVDQYGNPFLVNSDSVWNLAWGLDSADQATYLADRQADGFNTVLTDLVGNSTMHGSGNGANYAGDLPFTDANFTPNPAYWSKIGAFFQLAEKYGITVFAIPIDAYATAGGNVFAAMTTAQASAFGTFLASRYPQSAYPGIVWMLGNDYDGDGAGAGNVGGFASQYQAFLTALAAAGDTRPTMIEQGLSESLSTDGHTVGQMVTLNAGYSYHPTYEVIIRGRAAKKIPVLFFEGAYENATTGYPSTPLDIRKQLGWSMTSGAAGTFYGNDSLWPFGSGWQNQLDTSDVAQRKALNAAFAAISWQNLQPDVDSRLVISGRNSQYTAWSTVGTPYTNDATYGNYVSAAYTPDGTLAVIYNPDTTKNQITISSAVLGANPAITAVDPTDGARTSLGWTATPTMGTNAGGDHDWLFIITAG